MLNPKKITEIVDSVLSQLPEGLKDIPRDVQSHMKSCLSRSLEGLDLVSREEFDIQVKVLQKTRAKLESLEQQLEELTGSKGEA